MLMVGACGQSPAPPLQPAERQEEAGFLQPPRVLDAERSSQGVVLTGTGPPDAVIRVASPGGAAVGVQADAKGAWQVVAPPPSQVTLYGLSARLPDRAVQAEGYIAILPSPGDPAVLLRAGSGAELFGVGQGAVAIGAVDIDTAGAAIVSGMASPRQALAAFVDGAAVAQGAATDSGAYTLMLSATFPPGTRRIRVTGGSREAVVDLAVAPPQAPTEGAWRSERLANAWRIDWVTPGGGLQTSYILDPGARR
jgi:hypothetical protein